MIFAWLWLLLTHLSKSIIQSLPILDLKSFRWNSPNYISLAFTPTSRLSSYNSRGTGLHVEHLPCNSSNIHNSYLLVLIALIWNQLPEITKLTTFTQISLISKMSNLQGSPVPVVEARGDEACVFPLIEVVHLLFAYFSCVFVLSSSDDEDEDEDEDAQDDIATIGFIKSKIPSEKVKPVKSFEVVYPWNY